MTYEEKATAPVVKGNRVHLGGPFNSRTQPMKDRVGKGDGIDNVVTKSDACMGYTLFLSCI